MNFFALKSLKLHGLPQRFPAGHSADDMHLSSQPHLSCIGTPVRLIRVVGVIGTYCTPSFARVLPKQRRDASMTYLIS